MASQQVRAVDWAIGVGVAAVQVGLGAAAAAPLSASAIAGFAALVIGGLALVARRRWPVGVLVVTGACAVASQLAGLDVPVIAYLFAVFATVRSGRRVAAITVSLGMLLAVPLAIRVVAPDAALSVVLAQSRDVLQIAWIVAAGAAGEAVRQADRRAAEAERTLEETARRRADDERLHLARELHDSLTHQISVITMQAEVAVHLARRRGESVPEALIAIRDAAREASRELRDTLDALRSDGGATHTLADVPHLVERARLDGLDVAFAVDGDPRDLPSSVDRAGYRIVQEALTNVAKHAPGAPVSVRIERRADSVVIDVDDGGAPRRAGADRVGPSAPGGPSGEWSRTSDATAERVSGPEPTLRHGRGVGLVGMHERVTAVGGRLEAAPSSDGGFRVHAELPLDPRS